MMDLLIRIVLVIPRLAQNDVKHGKIPPLASLAPSVNAP